MRKNRREKGTEAMQEVPGTDAEPANHTAEMSTDASEGESAGTEILQQKVDDATEAEAEGVEQTGRTADTSKDTGERAARAGTEIFQRNVDTAQEALQSSAEIAARLAERSADQFGRMFGISGEEVGKAAQKSSDNLDAIMRSSSVVAEATQSISREWLNFTRECMEQNLNQFESLLRCRTPQDITAVHSKILRDNLERFLQFARRIAKITMQMPDEATKRTTEAVEGAQAA
jgi:hypothetical protein